MVFDNTVGAIRFFQGVPTLDMWAIPMFPGFFVVMGVRILHSVFVVILWVVVMLLVAVTMAANAGDGNDDKDSDLSNNSDYKNSD